MPDWVLATTKPNCELKAAGALARLDFTYKLFKLRTRTVRRGSVVDSRVVAFPGYLFVIPHGEHRTLIDRCDVTHLSAEEFSYDIVRDLLDRTDDGETIKDNELPKSERFRLSDKVKINTGASCGCVGIYQYMMPFAKCVIEVEWLGAYRPMTIDECDIEPMLTEAGRTKRSRRSRRSKSHRGVALSA